MMTANYNGNIDDDDGDGNRDSVSHTNSYFIINKHV